jgi:hypothetical protein
MENKLFYWIQERVISHKTRCWEKEGKTMMPGNFREEGD